MNLKAITWWHSLSINEMDAFLKKHYGYDFQGQRHIIGDRNNPPHHVIEQIYEIEGKE